MAGVAMAGLAGAPALADAVDGSLLAGLKARSIGPAGMSGRIAAIDAVADDPGTIFVGAATGGVWKSVNGGLNWAPVFDDMPCASIGSVAINQDNPDIVWVGTGEGNTRNSTSVGCGAFKSLDGGKTWQSVGLEGTERINRIVLHPDNPDIAYAAALGPLWGDGKDRGVYKTTDGGESWEKILYVNDSTGATDIEMVPGNPNKLFVSMWQFRRWPWYFKSGGPGSGLYVTHDGGENFHQLTEEDGLPEGTLGRSEFAISEADPNRIYALVEAEKSALIRSDDGGESWRTVNAEHDINDRPFYYNDLKVDPRDPNRVYRVGSRVKLSIDGGRTFEYIPAIDCCAPANTIHIDNHAFWINPNDPRHIIDGNDGGLAISRDKGETFRFVRNLPLAQYYHVAVDNDHPYHVYGGLQDNGSWRGPAEVFENGGIRNLHWQEVAFGDGFDTIPDPENSRRGYAMSQGGNLYRWNLDTGEMRLIRPNPPADDVTLRFNWDSGFAQSPHDAGTIYYGSQFVHKSTDRGVTWQVISPDMTTNDPDKQTFTESGGLTPDVTAAENYTAITVISPSPLDENVIWVGTDDGRVHVTRDGGESWDSVEDDMSGAPDGAWVEMIQPSPHDVEAAFITVDDHRRGDMGTYAFRVSDFGDDWDRINDDTVKGYAQSVRQDVVDEDLIFLGTEFGLWVSFNGGDDWTKWTEGVPTVSVRDMAIQQRESDLVLGTHGRAIYVIDDYSALRGLDADDFDERFKLLSVTNGQQYDPNQTPNNRFPGSGEFRADNEPYGVMLTFMASGDDLTHPDPEQDRARRIKARRFAGDEDTEKADPESDDDAGDEKAKKDEDAKKVTVKVKDNEGTVIRTFKADVHQGLNRVVWNMRRDGVRRAPPAKPNEDGTLPAGPEVLPGTYGVEMSFDDITETAEARVLKDPRTPYDRAAMEANHATLLRLQDMQRTMVAGLERITQARRDIGTLMTLIKDARKDDGEDETLDELSESAKALKKTLTELEKRFRVPPKTVGIVYSQDKVADRLGLAQFYVGSTYDRPSEAALDQIGRAERTLETVTGDLNRVLSEDLPSLRDAAASAGVGLLSQAPLALEQ